MTSLAKHPIAVPPVLAWLLLWALVGACRVQPAPPASVAAAPDPSGSSVPAPPSPTPSTPSLPATTAAMAVTISPVLAPDLAVALDITANGPADDLWHWTIDQPEPGSITTPIVTDGNGPVATQVTAKPDGWSLQLWQRIRTIASDQCPR